MSAINKPVFAARQSGMASIEVAFITIAFLIAVFGVIEIARAMYIVNTLQEVTRRAATEASNTKLGDTTALATVSQHAIFRDSAGTLVFSDPITDQNVRIDYLALVRAADGTMTMQPIPSGSTYCPAKNRLTCLAAPNSPNCARFVRARICDTGDSANCNPVAYQSLFSMVNFPVSLPLSTTIVSADTLGFVPGTPPCP